MDSILLISKVFSANSPGRVDKFAKRVELLSNHGWHVHILTPREPGYDYKSNFASSSNPKPEIHVTTSLLTPVRRKYYALQYGDINPSEKENQTISGSPSDVIRHKIKNWLKDLVLDIKPWVFIPDGWIGWYPYGIRQGRKILQKNNIDVIYSASSPYTAHMVAAQLSEESELPWVATFRDPWVNNPLIPKSPVWKLVSQQLEKKVISQADKIVTYKGWFPDDGQYLYETYPRHQGKIEILPYIGFDPRDFEQHPNENEGPFTIIHAGNFYGDDYSPEKFLQAVRRVIDSNEIDEIRVYLLGALGEEYKRLIHKLELTRSVIYKGVVPYEEVVNHLEKSDVGLWVMGKKNSYESNVPSKVFDYIGAQIPILAVVPEGPAREFIQKYDLGVTADPTEPDSIAQSIITLYNRSQTGNTKLDMDYTIFNRENTIEAFEQVLQEVSQ